MKPGAMTHLLRFQSRTQVEDGMGNMVSSDWADRFERWAELRARPGSETVLAARLEGRRPASARVWRDPETETITNDWRAVDENGTEWAVRSAGPDTVDGAIFLLMLEAGVAA